MTNANANANDESSSDQSQGITDDQLPEDLRPSEENPLAEPLSEDDAPDDLDELGMDGGNGAAEWDDEELED